MVISLMVIAKNKKTRFPLLDISNRKQVSPNSE